MDPLPRQNFLDTCMQCSYHYHLEKSISNLGMTCTLCHFYIVYNFGTEIPLIIQQRKARSDATFFDVWSGSSLSAYVPQKIQIQSTAHLQVHVSFRWFKKDWCQLHLQVHVFFRWFKKDWCQLHLQVHVSFRWFKKDWCQLHLQVHVSFRWFKKDWCQLQAKVHVRALSTG